MVDNRPVVREITHLDGQFKGYVRLDFEEGKSVYMLEGTLLDNFHKYGWKDGTIIDIRPEQIGGRDSQTHVLVTLVRGDGPELFTHRVSRYPTLQEGSGTK